MIAGGTEQQQLEGLEQNTGVQKTRSRNDTTERRNGSVEASMVQRVMKCYEEGGIACILVWRSCVAGHGRALSTGKPTR